MTYSPKGTETVLTLEKAAATQRILTANFLSICFANFGASASFCLLIASLPIYIKGIGGTQSEIGAVLGAVTVTAVLVRPLVGARADRRGKKGLMLAGIILMVASSLLYLEARSIGLLFLVRIVHGAGWGAFSTASAALLADVVPPQRRGEAMGYFGAFGSLAMAVGPAAGVMIAESSGGFTLMFSIAAGVAGLAAVSSAGARDVLTPPVAPLVPVSARLFNRKALYPSAILVFFALSYGSVLSFLSLFTKERELGNPGLFFAVLAVVTMVSRGPVGRLSDKHGRLAIVAPSLVAGAASLALVANAGSLGVLLLAAVVCGLSSAAVQPSLMALVGDRIGPAESGAAMATFSTALDLGLGVGSVVWGVVAQLSDYGTMYLIAAATMLLGLAVILVGHVRRL